MQLQRQPAVFRNFDTASLVAVLQPPELELRSISKAWLEAGKVGSVISHWKTCIGGLSWCFDIDAFVEQLGEKVSVSRLSPSYFHVFSWRRAQLF